MDVKDIKSNSNRLKEEKKEVEETRAKKVVKGEVKEKKTSTARKLASFIVPEDVEDAKNYIWLDVVVPATKNIIRDIVDAVLFGSSGNRRSGGGYTNYNRMSSNRRDGAPRTSNRRISEFKEVIFDSRGDAEEVLDCMDEILSRYDSVRVADFNELVGKTGHYTDNKYGWVDLREASVVRDGGGYRIKLPRPLPL